LNNEINVQTNIENKLLYLKKTYFLHKNLEKRMFGVFSALRHGKFRAGNPDLI